MKIEIELPDSVLEDAAVAAWRSAFTSGSGYGQTGDGAARIKQAIRDKMDAPGFAALVEQCVVKHTNAVMDQYVREAVIERMRVMAKRIAKETVTDDLFKEAKP